MKEIQREIYYIIERILRQKTAGVDTSYLLDELEDLDNIHEKDLENIVSKIKELISYIDNV